MVLPVLLVQMCIGSVYSWSIFNSALDKVWGQPGLNTNAFLLSIASFGLSTLLFGTFVERNGPFRAVCLTVVLTPAGWALACLGSYKSLYGCVSLRPPGPPPHCPLSCAPACCAPPPPTPSPPRPLPPCPPCP
jgi:hypothetical protein